MSTTTATATSESPVDPRTEQIYSWKEPPTCEHPLQWKQHFSSLLFGGSLSTTILEHILLALPFVSLLIWGPDKLNVEGSMPFAEMALFFVATSLVRRVYNAYLEAVYFTFPKYRTQPIKEHRLKGKKKDLCGRDLEQLELLDSHDKMTLLSQFVLNVGVYYAIPGYYPSVSVEQTNLERFLRLILNHYVMSFGMYWLHRAYHVIPWLWHIHSIHHYAKHPLSRNTYEDHWLDNFGAAVFGHLFATILIPLDHHTFWFSHVFRILESLEKHSGVSCGYNLAHSMQRWLPFAQMPHHHDWHHEGFKGSNYTFASIGGLWDCIFDTRKSGRYGSNLHYAATREDYNSKKEQTKGALWWFCKDQELLPLFVLTGAVIYKLMTN
jgi:sterol desaturase/sphingolipid hydroxylase (fatty acid hydroxylase superfamily)